MEPTNPRGKNRLSRFRRKKGLPPNNSLNAIKENTVKENTVKENTVKENTVKENTVKENTVKENTVKENMVSGLMITAELNESVKTNGIPASVASITVCCKPGTSPTARTVLKLGNGELKVFESKAEAVEFQESVDRKAALLGTITIGEKTGTIPEDGKTDVKVDERKSEREKTTIVDGCVYQHKRKAIPESRTFQIFVNNFNGRTVALNVQKEYRVEKVMGLIADKVGVADSSQLRLTHNTKPLLVGMTLEQYCVRANETLFMIRGRLPGCVKCGQTCAIGR